MLYSYFSALVSGALSRLFGVIDPHYDQVLLLLHGNGVNGSTIFADSGPLARTPESIAATVALSTADKKFGLSSMSFTGGRIYYPINAFDMGSRNFTMEGWAKYTGAAGSRAFILGSAASDGGNGRISIYRADNDVMTGVVIIDGTPYSATAGATPASWFHFALVRQGTVLTLFINGVPGTSTTIPSGAIANAANKWAIGGVGEYTNGGYNTLSGDRWVGFLDDIRITTVARYTAAFTPSENQFYDLVSDAWYANVILHTHFDGSNNTAAFFDSSPNAITLSKSGDAKLTTSTFKFGGASLALDGSGDVVTGSHSTLALGTADFTIEFFLNPTPASSSSYARIVQIGSNSSSGGLWIVRDATTNPMRVLVQVHTGSGYVTVFAGSLTVPTGSWSHIALTRDAGVWRLFVNGALDSSVTYTATGNNITQTAMHIGNNNLNTESLSGSIDELRVTAGVARYTATFAPPTSRFYDRAPWNSISTWLTFENSSFTDVGPRPKSFTATGGDAVISTTQAFSGSSSLSVTGSSYISAPDHADFQLGTSDFTIECRIYVTSLPSSGDYRGICGRRTNSSNMSYSLYINGDAGGAVRFDTETSGGLLQVSGGLPSVNAWTHVAVTRCNGLLRVFVDGVSGTAVTINTNSITDGSYIFHIGQLSTGSLGYPLNGYIDNLRVYKGKALYVDNFVPSA